MILKHTQKILSAIRPFTSVLQFVNSLRNIYESFLNYLHSFNKTLALSDSLVELKLTSIAQLSVMRYTLVGEAEYQYGRSNYCDSQVNRLALDLDCRTMHSLCCALMSISNAAILPSIRGRSTVTHKEMYFPYAAFMMSKVRCDSHYTPTVREMLPFLLQVADTRSVRILCMSPVMLVISPHIIIGNTGRLHLHELRMGASKRRRGILA